LHLRKRHPEHENRCEGPEFWQAAASLGILCGGCEVEIWKSSQETKILGED